MSARVRAVEDTGAAAATVSSPPTVTAMLTGVNFMGVNLPSNLYGC